MNKTVLTILFCLGIFRVSAQFTPPVVHDPVNYTALGEIIVSAQQQLVKVEEQLSFAKKAADRIEKVNEAIKGVEIVRESFERGAETIQRVNRIFSAIKDMDGFSVGYIEMCTRRCTQACQQVVSNMIYMEKSLGVGLNMSDKERLETLQENLNAINAEAMAIERLEREAKRLADKRRLLKIF